MAGCQGPGVLSSPVSSRMGLGAWQRLCGADGALICRTPPPAVSALQR